MGIRPPYQIIRPFFMENVFEVHQWTLFAPFVCDFIFLLRWTSIESYARLNVKTNLSLISYDTETTRTIYQVVQGAIYLHSSSS